ncbi:MAG: glycosyltransferase 2 family protein [Candidatus Sumerlaeota bacterium]|nr:glycosyltransferase 2 family protein [Candidatus Sumerlaeota bacterium]
MSRKKLISTAVALILSGIFLYFAFRRIEFGRLIETFRTIQWGYAVPFVAVTWVTFYWRGWRWQKLLRGTHDLKMNDVYGPMMIGFAFNSIFPARAGEFARPLALTKKAGVPYTTGLSSVLVERIWDMLALLTAFIVCSLLIEFDDSFSYQYGDITITPALLKGIILKMTVLAGILLCGSLCMLSEGFRGLVRKVLHWLPYVPEKLKGKLIAIFEAFAMGFGGLKRPIVIAQVALDSLGIWFLTALTLWIMALGFPTIEMTVVHALVFLVVTCVMVSLPSVPGYWGVYEVGGLVALAICLPEVDENTAMSFTLFVHFLQWALVTAIGLYYAGRIHVSVKEVETKKTELPT